MANILDLIKEVEKMNMSRPYSNDPDISQFLHGVHGEYTEDKKRQIGNLKNIILHGNSNQNQSSIDRKSISSMIQPQISESDKTMVDVYGLKSQAADDMSGIHTTLAGLGMIPAAGNIADALDTILYLAEGDVGGAGLSALSMLPFAGLAAGGIKAVKGGAKALKKGFSPEDVAREAKEFGMAQDVVGKFGGDISDPKLVSNIHEEISGAVTSYTDMGKNITEPLLKAGYSTDDAIALTTYVQSKTPEGIKATKELAGMGLSEIDMWGKEAVEAMNKSQQRAAEILMEDALTGGKLHKMLGLDF